MLLGPYQTVDHEAPTPYLAKSIIARHMPFFSVIAPPTLLSTLMFSFRDAMVHLG
jgi:hypothetical protein